jgi:hypothetical protein
MLQVDLQHGPLCEAVSWAHAPPAIPLLEPKTAALGAG